ncbi:copper oxidase [Clostridium beijerinckii]|uniref:Copper oxidase n=1 Tax=Clostridium beijerinckii TaxID=1520 RepID=A0A0B5QH89_CLOBE|nr:multicopper oxidase domain-containing protein [Clostridium beijerinckii]AJG97606.1 copper oxidase [Clostridium beijerinckii]
MSIRHYVLLATDGSISLPKDEILCTTNRENVYIFGFTGGLLDVDGVQIEENKYLDYTDPANWDTIFMKKGTATIPSPIIWGEVGDHIYITLINIGMEHLPDLKDFHTVHMHGAHVATQLDGFPESSFGVPMWEQKEGQPLEAPPKATYFFQPEDPGTLMYHCHVEASEHVQMGMYGALVIYPSMKSLAKNGITKCNRCGRWKLNGQEQYHIPKTATNRNFAYNNIHSYFDKEYVMLLSDIDSAWHESVSIPNNPNPFNAVDFKPDFWLINGRAFPDTLLPHPLSVGSDPNLTQINYESYVHVKTNEKFLLRMINMGYQVVPWHIHGWHFMVVGKDSNLSPFLVLAEDCKHINHKLTEMGFTNTIGSGETYDLIITADDKRGLYRNYIVNGQDGFPSLCEQLNEISKIDPTAIFDIPEEPVNCANPQLINYIEICNQPYGDPNNKFFPQFYPMHNHDDYKVTNNGKYPGGQLTMIQADAPDKPM